MKTLVIIPTFNERENINPLLDGILAQPCAVDVLVADDQSPDGTGQCVLERGRTDPRVQLLALPTRLGYGRAVLAGLRQALDRGYDAAVTMDADLSHDPRYLPDLLGSLESGNDLVVGSRYLNGISVVNWPLRRLMLSLFANNYVRTITGLPLNDCTTGYRAMRRSVLEAIGIDSIHSNGYSFISEVNYRAHQKGFKLAEVPIIFVERRAGGSKMSFKVMLEAVWMPWRLRLGI